jgi:hypothetical protein
MYKIISFFVMISISFMPVAIAAEVPFYLRDNSPFPNRNVQPKNSLYVPKKIPYADWLVKRAAEVSAKLDDCYKELDTFKNPHNEKEETEKKWILLKIAKKDSYLKFLNEKFTRVTGSTLADSGYNFSSKEVKENFDVASEKCSTPTGSKSPMSKNEAVEEKQNSIKSEPVRTEPVSVVEMKDSPSLVLVKDSSIVLGTPKEEKLEKESDLSSKQKEEFKVDAEGGAMMLPLFADAMNTESSKPTNEEKAPEKAPLSKPETNAPNLPESLELKKPEDNDQDKDKKDNENNSSPEDTEMAKEKINASSTKMSLVEETTAPADEVKNVKPAEPVKLEKSSTESSIPLVIIEDNRKQAVQKIEDLNKVSNETQVTTVEVKPMVSEAIQSPPLTAPIISEPEVQTPPLTAPLSVEAVTEVKEVKPAPSVAAPPSAELSPIQTIEAPKAESLEVKELDNKAPAASVETKVPEVKIQEVKLKEVKFESVKVEKIEEKPKAIVQEAKEVVAQPEQPQSSLKHDQEVKEMSEAIAKKLKADEKPQAKKEQPVVIKNEEESAPVEEKKEVNHPTHINDRIMEEGEIQEETGPSY